jgi:hypothetical protein
MDFRTRTRVVNGVVVAVIIVLVLWVECVWKGGEDGKRRQQATEKTLLSLPVPSIWHDGGITRSHYKYERGEAERSVISGESPASLCDYYDNYMSSQHGWGRGINWCKNARLYPSGIDGLMLYESTNVGFSVDYKGNVDGYHYTLHYFWERE